MESAALMFAASCFVPFATRRFIDLSIGCKRSRHYFLDPEAAEKFSKDCDGLQKQQKQKLSFSYGTVVYVPANPVIDFGPTPVWSANASWTPTYEKKDVCSRVLMVSMWSNGKLTLPGGRAKARLAETPVEVMNREFGEETGCMNSTLFDQADYRFSYISERDKKLCHYYCKILHDEAEFNRIASAFCPDGCVRRKGFIDEIFGVVSLPVWVEGPANSKTGTFWGPSQVWGLPRLLGAIPFYEDLLILLYRSNVLSRSMLQRVVELKCALQMVELHESWSKFVVVTIQWLLGTTAEMPNFASFVHLHSLDEDQL